MLVLVARRCAVEDPQITTKLQPWQIPSGLSVEDASMQLGEVLKSYPPGGRGGWPEIIAAGQQNVDGGGFQILKSGQDGYFYAQFESLKSLDVTISDIDLMANWALQA